MIRAFAPANPVEPPESSKIFIEIEINSDFEDEYGILSDFRLSFENHLDFLLWQKGWDFKIISESRNFSERDYFLEKKRGAITRRFRLTVKPEIIPLAERNKQAREKGYMVNYPLLGKLTVDLELLSGESVISGEKATVLPRKEWLQRSLVPEGADSPTPPDIMIKEVLGKLFDKFPSYPRRFLLPKNNINLFLYYDSRYQSEELNPERKYIDRALEYASDLFYRQFGYGLKVVNVEYVDLPGNTLEDMSRNHIKMMRSAQPSYDNLVATVYPPVDAGYYYSKGRSYHVGLSHIGNRHMMTAHIPAPSDDLKEWESFINSLLILHEIGHLLGAVHVFDARSIMYTESPWLASVDFDELNKAIIRSAIKDHRPLRKVDTYLELVMNEMDSTTYNKADFGLFLWEFAQVNPHFKWDDNMFDSKVHRSASYALEGIRSLYHGDKKRAQESLYKALSLTPDQGALHFWIARATEGSLAEEHLKKSAELGFSEAIYRLMRQE